MATSLYDKDPKPGDLIEIFRGAFQHWAVYIGRNEVVHLLPPNTNADTLVDQLFSLLSHNTAQVRCQKIWEVVGSDRYQVNNILDDECHPRNPRHIVSDARRMVGQALPYSVATNNCEHFVTELRYGKAESRQARVAQNPFVVGALAVGFGAIMLRALLQEDDDDDKRKRRYQ